MDNDNVDELGMILGMVGSHDGYKTVIEQWGDGLISDSYALRALCADLGEIENEQAALETERTKLRGAIEKIVLRQSGQRSEVKGFGTLAITGGGVRTSYDTKALDSLLAKLLSQGYPEIAEELAAARRETGVSAALRITRERGTR